MVHHTITWNKTYTMLMFSLNLDNTNKDFKNSVKYIRIKPVLPDPTSVDRASFAEAVFNRGPIIEFDAPFPVEAAGLFTVDKAVTSKRSRREKRLELI